MTPHCSDLALLLGSQGEEYGWEAATHLPSKSSGSCRSPRFISKQAPLQGALWAPANNLTPVAMAKCYATAMAALHKEVRFTPVCCPVESSSKRCWLSPASPRQYLQLFTLCPHVPGQQPCSPVPPISLHAIHHTRGKGSNAIVDIPAVSQPWGLLPCCFSGPAVEQGVSAAAARGKQCCFHHQSRTSGSTCGGSHQILHSDQELRGLPAPPHHLHQPCLPELCHHFSEMKQGGRRLPASRCTRRQGLHPPSLSGTSQRCERVKLCCWLSHGAGNAKAARGWGAQRSSTS